MEAGESGCAMQHDPGNPLRHRIEVELVEADVEIGFNLVDLAGEEFEAGHPAAVTRVLHDADDVLDDIDQRLLHLDTFDQASFGPLVAELRREVESAKSRYSNPLD